MLVFDTSPPFHPSHSFPPLSYPTPSIESTLHRGPVAPMSTPSVRSTLWWGLVQTDTSFTPGPHGPGVLLLLLLDQGLQWMKK
jgi:hypothetical protein